MHGSYKCRRLVVPSATAFPSPKHVHNHYSTRIYRWNFTNWKGFASPWWGLHFVNPFIDETSYCTSSMNPTISGGSQSFQRGWKRLSHDTQPILACMPRANVPFNVKGGKSYFGYAIGAWASLEMKILRHWSAGIWIIFDNYLLCKKQFVCLQW